MDEAGEVEYVIGTGIDLTHQKRLEQEILRISDLEQRRIGHDLHDGLCQQLAGIEFMSQALRQRLETASPPNAEVAGQICRSHPTSHHADARTVARPFAGHARTGRT